MAELTDTDRRRGPPMLRSARAGDVLRAGRQGRLLRRGRGGCVSRAARGCGAARAVTSVACTHATPLPHADRARADDPSDDEVEVFGAGLYGEEATSSRPPSTASLGCGVPTAVADLREGETVLDLGSGAGADVLISARRVGPTGKAIGLDMTDEMLELARDERSGRPGSRTSSSCKG